MKCAALSKPDSSSDCENFILGIIFCFFIGLIIIFFIDKYMRPYCSNACKTETSHPTERVEKGNPVTSDIADFSMVRSIMTLSKENTAINVESGNVFVTIKRPNKKAQEILLDPLCVNCHLSFKTGDVVAYCSNEDCEHVYHQNCISPWLCIKDKCPGCNRMFFKDDELEVLDEVHINDSTKANEIVLDISEKFECLPCVDNNLGSGYDQFPEKISKNSSFHENLTASCASRGLNQKKGDSIESFIDYSVSIPLKKDCNSEKNDNSEENDKLAKFHSNIVVNHYSKAA